MNKRIYFNDKYIELVDKKDAEIPAIQANIIEGEINLKKKLKIFIENFLSEKNPSAVKSDQFTLGEIITFFRENYYYIEAAGGLISQQERYLFILRHGLWDLPKGKLEKGESLDHAAIRECEEECAVKDLIIDKRLASTFHIYPFKNSFALKQAYWYAMHTTYSEKLVPQLEESITEVQWFDKKEIKDRVLSNTYYTIRDVVLSEIEM